MPSIDPPPSIRSLSSLSNSPSDFTAFDMSDLDALTLVDAVPDPQGFLETSMITVLVEDTKFRMDSYFLQRESETLKAMITASPADSVIRLEGVTIAEFKALWRYFYEGMYDDYNPTATEWMDLLSIAHNFGFSKVHSRAIAEIDDLDDTIDPVERILLAKRLNVTKWLAPAYAALCARTDPINASEAEQLGMYTFVALVAARESFYRETTSLSPNRDPTSLVTSNLRCCGYTPSQWQEGVNGARKCPSCQQDVIRPPTSRTPLTNNNRRCCNYAPQSWQAQPDGSQRCPSCQGTVVPAPIPVVTPQERALVTVRRVFDLGEIPTEATPPPPSASGDPVAETNANAARNRRNRRR